MRSWAIFGTLRLGTNICDPLGGPPTAALPSRSTVVLPMYARTSIYKEKSPTKTHADAAKRLCKLRDTGRTVQFVDLLLYNTTRSHCILYT